MPSAYNALGPEARADPTTALQHFRSASAVPAHALLPELIHDLSPDLPTAPWRSWPPPVLAAAFATVVQFTRQDALLSFFPPSAPEQPQSQPQSQASTQISSTTRTLLRTLLFHAQLLPPSTRDRRPQMDHGADGEPTVQLALANDALRALANTLLLHPHTRPLALQFAIAPLCLRLLQPRPRPFPSTTTSPLNDSDPAIDPALELRAEKEFLLARLLFLQTATMHPYILPLVREESIVQHLQSALDGHLRLYLAAYTPPSSTPHPSSPSSFLTHTLNTLTDILKTVFNLTLFYPQLVDLSPDLSPDPPPPAQKTQGQKWRFQPLLRPILALILTFPALSIIAPIKQAIHALLNFPPDMIFAACAAADQDKSRHQTANIPFSLPSSPHLPSSSSSSSSRLLRPFARLSPSLSSGPLPHQGSSSTLSRLAERLLTLLQGSFDRFVQADATTLDQAQIAKASKAESLDFDELICSSLLVLRNLSATHLAVKQAVKTRILPADLDRSSRIETRTDLTGRLVQLLSSTFTASANSSGELLFAICDQDAQKLCSGIGYGNAAGFLSSKGLLMPPAAQPSQGRSDIDPITGSFRQETKNSLDDMTEEEKEAEAEKLYGMFERLNRNGVLKVQNPVKTAAAEGRLQEIDSHAPSTDANDEKEVEDMMKRYRTRVGRETS